MSRGQMRIHRDWEDLAGAVLSKASKMGLEARISISGSSRLSVRVRKGELEELRQSEPSGASIRLFKDHRSVSGSTSHLTREALSRLVDRLAPAIDLIDRDEAVGPPDPDLLYTTPVKLDIYDLGLEEFPVDKAKAMALNAEKAGFALDSRIKNSSGASLGVATGSQWLATSQGMKGWEVFSSISCSVGLIAEDDQGEKFSGSWWDQKRHLEDLDDPGELGRIAARRAVDSIGVKPVRTGKYPVLFAPETSGALLAHLFECAAGDAVYKGATFLRDSEGKPIVSERISIVDDPRMLRGLASTPFDSEGVATSRRVLVDKGKLMFFPCDSYSARRLSRKSTGHSSGGVVGSYNLYIQKGDQSVPELLKKMNTGLWVTSFIGHGFNRTTGDLSRGVRGFWIQDGTVAHPVQEITISGQLGEMLTDVEGIGNDLTFRNGTDAPSLLVRELTVSGAG